MLVAATKPKSVVQAPTPSPSPAPSPSTGSASEKTSAGDSKKDTSTQQAVEGTGSSDGKDSQGESSSGDKPAKSGSASEPSASDIKVPTGNDINAKSVADVKQQIEAMLATAQGDEKTALEKQLAEVKSLETKLPPVNQEAAKSAPPVGRSPETEKFLSMPGTKVEILNKIDSLYSETYRPGAPGQAAQVERQRLMSLVNEAPSASGVSSKAVKLANQEVGRFGTWSQQELNGLQNEIKAAGKKGPIGKEQGQGFQKRLDAFKDANTRQQESTRKTVQQLAEKSQALKKGTGSDPALKPTQVKFDQIQADIRERMQDIELSLRTGEQIGTRNVADVVAMRDAGQASMSGSTENFLKLTGTRFDLTQRLSQLEGEQKSIMAKGPDSARTPEGQKVQAQIDALQADLKNTPMTTKLLPTAVSNARTEIRTFETQSRQQLSTLQKEIIEAGKNGKITPEQSQMYLKRLDEARQSLKTQQALTQNTVNLLKDQTNTLVAKVDNPDTRQSIQKDIPKAFQATNQQLDQAERRVLDHVKDVEDAIRIAEQTGTGDLGKLVAMRDEARTFADQTTAQIQKARTEMVEKITAARTENTGELGPNGKPINVISDPNAASLRETFGKNAETLVKATTNEPLNQAYQKTFNQAVTKFGAEQVEKVITAARNGQDLTSVLPQGPENAAARQELKALAFSNVDSARVDQALGEFGKVGTQIVSKTEFIDRRNELLLTPEVQKDKVLAVENQAKNIDATFKALYKVHQDMGLMDNAGDGLTSIVSGVTDLTTLGYLRDSGKLPSSMYSTAAEMITRTRPAMDNLGKAVNDLRLAKTPAEAGAAYERIRASQAELAKSEKVFNESIEALSRNAAIGKNVILTTGTIAATVGTGGAGFTFASAMQAAAVGTGLRVTSTLLNDATSAQGITLDGTGRQIGIDLAMAPVDALAGFGAAKLSQFANQTLSKSLTGTSPLVQKALYGAIDLTLNDGSTNVVSGGFDNILNNRPVLENATQNFMSGVIFGGGVKAGQAGISALRTRTTQTVENPGLPKSNPSAPETRPTSTAKPLPVEPKINMPVEQMQSRIQAAAKESGIPVENLSFKPLRPGEPAYTRIGPDGKVEVGMAVDANGKVVAGQGFHEKAHLDLVSKAMQGDPQAIAQVNGASRAAENLTQVRAEIEREIAAGRSLTPEMAKRLTDAQAAYQTSLPETQARAGQHKETVDYLREVLKNSKAQDNSFLEAQIKNQEALAAKEA